MNNFTYIKKRVKQKEMWKKEEQNCSLTVKKMIEKHYLAHQFVTLLLINNSKKTNEILKQLTVLSD